jgi:hypothetical protein
MNNVQRLLTPRQVAELEGVGQTEIYKRLALGQYDALKDGKRTKITEASVLKFTQGSIQRPEGHSRLPIKGGSFRVMRSHPRIIRPAVGKKNAGSERQLVPAKGNLHNAGIQRTRLVRKTNYLS